jgi:serine/threonine-protein kinase
VELDDMKNAWLALDRRLQRHEALNLHAFKESRLDKLRASLRPLVTGQVIQLIVGVLLMFVFAPYWVEHRQVPHLLLTGLALHAYALMFILFAARDLYMIQRIDYSAPVLEIQRRLAELRAWRIRVAPIFGALGCLIWIPLMLWLFDVVFGVDVYAANPRVVVAFLASGFVCLALLLALIRWSRHPSRARIAKSLDDSAAGRSVSKAQRFLDEVAAFAREP